MVKLLLLCSWLVACAKVPYVDLSDLPGSNVDHRPSKGHDDHNGGGRMSKPIPAWPAKVRTPKRDKQSDHKESQREARQGKTPSPARRIPVRVPLITSPLRETSTADGNSETRLNEKRRAQTTTSTSAAAQDKHADAVEDYHEEDKERKDDDDDDLRDDKSSHKEDGQARHEEDSRVNQEEDPQVNNEEDGGVKNEDDEDVERGEGEANVDHERTRVENAEPTEVAEPVEEEKEQRDERAERVGEEEATIEERGRSKDPEDMEEVTERGEDPEEEAVDQRIEMLRVPFSKAPIETFKAHAEILVEPRCASLAYVNLVFRSDSPRIRRAIRAQVAAQRANITFPSPNSNAIEKWLSTKFSIPHRAPLGADLPPITRAIFPVGLPCRSQSESCQEQLDALYAEADTYHDMIIGDYEDSVQSQGIKMATVLDFFSKCRPESPWQWIIRAEPHMVVNIPNTVYFCKAQDLISLSVEDEDGDSEGSHKPSWWFGLVLNGINVVKDPPEDVHAEANYDGDTYPPYTSKRFYGLNRRLVTPLISQYVADDVVYRNEDAMIGILADKVNREKGDHKLAPVYVPGIEVTNRETTAMRICGKAAEKDGVVHIKHCSCHEWLAYPPKNGAERADMLTHLQDTCTFIDMYTRR